MRKSKIARRCRTEVAQPLFNNRFFVYVGREVEKVVSPFQDEGEDLEVVLVPLREIWA